MQIWEEAEPDLPASTWFLDENVENQYRDEKAWGLTIGYASGLAVVIACLGLFGLTALSVIRRTKEIGVRKAVGASERRIFALLSSDLLRLVLVANVIAWPLSYLVMDEWLSRFVYRVSIGTRCLPARWSGDVSRRRRNDELSDAEGVENESGGGFALRIIDTRICHPEPTGEGSLWVLDHSRRKNQGRCRPRRDPSRSLS